MGWRAYPLTPLSGRWRQLKAKMIEKRSKLGESQTLQQFSRDVDEIEAWISEKLQTATDESYKDPTNIQVRGGGRAGERGGGGVCECESESVSTSAGRRSCPPSSGAHVTFCYDDLTELVCGSFLAVQAAGKCCLSAD